MRKLTKEPFKQEQNLTEYPLFNILNEDELLKLNNEISFSMFKRRSVLYEKGSRLNHCFFIIKGIVKIIITGSDGKEQIIRFAKKGEIIGYRSLLSLEPACSGAKVIDDALVCHIPSQTLHFLIQNNWQFSHRMLQVLSSELRESNDYIVGLAQKSIRERLAEVLLLLKESFQLDNQNRLQILLKRDELADFVGTAPESVIRALYELKHENLIELKGKEIKFLDEPSLHRIANI